MESIEEIEAVVCADVDEAAEEEEAAAAEAEAEALEACTCAIMSRIFTYGIRSIDASAQ